MFWTYHLYFYLVIILVLLCVTNIFKARIRIRAPQKKATKFELKDVKFSLFGGLLSHTYSIAIVDACKASITIRIMSDTRDEEKDRNKDQRCVARHPRSKN